MSTALKAVKIIYIRKPEQTHKTPNIKNLEAEEFFYFILRAD